MTSEEVNSNLLITNSIMQVFNEEYNIGEAENLFSGCTFNRCIVGAKAHVEHFKWEIKQDPTLLDRNDDRRPSLVKVFLCLASEASRRGTMCQHVLDWARSLEASYANASEDYTRRGVPVLVLTVEEERFRFYPTERRDILAWENMDRISGLECRRCSEDVCLGYCELENGCQLCLECGRSEKIVAMRVASELGVLQELLEEWGPVPEDCLCRQEGLLGGEVEDTGLGNILLDDCVPPCEDYEQKPVKLADDGQLVVGGRLSPAEALAYLKKTAHRTKEEVERRGLELAKEFEGWALYAGPRQDFANVKQLALEPEAPAVGWTEMGYGDLDLPGGDGAGAAGPSFGTQDTPQIQAASSSDARAEKSGAVMCAGCGGGTRGCIIHPQVRWGGVEGHDAGGGVALASTTTGVDSLERCGVTALLSDETPPPAKRARRPHRPRAFLTLVSTIMARRVPPSQKSGDFGSFTGLIDHMCLLCRSLVRAHLPETSQLSLPTQKEPPMCCIQIHK